MINVTLPELKEGTDESLVVLWFVSEGDRVRKGDALAEVQTEKAVSEIEAEADGVVKKIAVKRGESAKVGDVLAVIDPEGSPEPAVEEAPPEKKEQEKVPDAPKVPPKLKKLARELGVQVETIRGTGKDGRITEEDIRRGGTEQEKRLPLTGTRGVIARRMVESLQESAQLTETAWADVTRLDLDRKEFDGDPGWTALTAVAAARALKNHPLLNAHIEGEEIVLKESVHLGFAIDTKDGLQVAVVKETDSLSPGKLQEQLAEKASRARNKGLSKEDMEGGTFTVTSLGGYRTEFFTPIINPPQTAILGIGRIQPYVAMYEMKPREKYRLPLSLTVDHRAVDGAPAAAFLDEVIDLLEHPDRLFGEEADD
ncbi:MAG: 2-oxo acid dehydrogenase subunit E2 [Alkalicoccus sp.]|nr:MAG: 2-oxo acid dehydrogenase subunit E2 [Alkalicoccus sp.]